MNENNQIKIVAIMTPYLANIADVKPFDDDRGFGHKGWNMDLQRALYGYNPKNLIQGGMIKTNAGKNLVIYRPEWKNGAERDYQAEELSKMKPLLIVAGSTVPGEVETNMLKGSGIVVGRYSIFYGGNSKYTGNSAERGGYSLDIPKNPEVVKTLLNHDKTLDAIISKDSESVKSALNDLKTQLQKNNLPPVLATGYINRVFIN